MSRCRSGSPTPSSRGSTSNLFQDEVKISPDKATNSLVIVAPSRDFLTLRDVIRRLDIPRRQRFIETTILEISLSNSRDLGLAYHGGVSALGGVAVGGLESSSLNSLQPLSILSASDPIGGVIGPQCYGADLAGARRSYSAAVGCAEAGSAQRLGTSVLLRLADVELRHGLKGLSREPLRAWVAPPERCSATRCAGR